MRTFCVLTLIMFNTFVMASSQRTYATSRKIFDTPSVSASDCGGSLLIEAQDGSRQIIQGNVVRTNIVMRSISVNGCGCYSVHSRRNGRGSRVVLSSSSGIQNTFEIGFGRIRSIYKIDCLYSA